MRQCFHQKKSIYLNGFLPTNALDLPCRIFVIRSPVNLTYYDLLGAGGHLSLRNSWTFVQHSMLPAEPEGMDIMDSLHLAEESLESNFYKGQAHRSVINVVKYHSHTLPETASLPT